MGETMTSVDVSAPVYFVFRKPAAAEPSCASEAVLCKGCFLLDFSVTEPGEK